MSAGEIESVLLDTPWTGVFEDKTVRSQRTLRRKSDDQLNLYGPKLGLGKNSSLLPGGAVAGQKIGLLFEQLVSQRTRASDFDDLPNPYRAVSADLVTGNMVLLDSGQLSLAMRSSMSVPGAFDPVRSGDTLLVDGGIVNNVPVDIARDMGAEIVIAVDVSTPEMSADELDNLLSVVNQLTTLMVSNNTERQLASLTEHDVLVKPELGTELTSADFARIGETVGIGYAAAERNAGRLQTLSLSPEEYAAWREGIANCTSPPTTLKFVRLDNNSRFSDEVIRAKVNVQAGDVLDQDRLQSDISHVYGLGFIRNAQYRLVEEDGETGIIIEVNQDSRGTDFIETGIGISSDGRGSSLDLRAAYLKTDLNDRGAEFRGAVQLGAEFGLSADVYLPLDDQLRWILKPELFASRRELLTFDDNGHAVAQLDVDEFGGEFKFGREFRRHAGLFVGFNRYAGEIGVNIGPPLTPDYTFHGGEWLVTGIYDRLDELYMPSSGDYIRLEYARSTESLGADEAFEQLKASWFSARSRDQHTLWLSSQFNTTLDGIVPLYGQFTGGGFLRMSGFETNELIGQHFGFSLLGYRYRMNQDGMLPAYVGATIEYGGAAQDRSDVYGNGTLNGSLYLGYDSPIGPLYLGYGWNNEQSGLLFIRLGSILGSDSIGRR
jgi:NTE family protein